MFNPAMVSNREQFYAKNGSDSVFVKKLGILVFSNGASMERAMYGALWDPPTDARERSKLKIAYREELLLRAMDDFSERKEQLLAITRSNAANGTPAVLDAEIEQLTALQNVARQCQRDLDAAREELRASEPADQIGLRKVMAENRQRNELLHQLVREIKV